MAQATSVYPITPKEWEAVITPLSKLRASIVAEAGQFPRLARSMLTVGSFVHQNRRGMSLDGCARPRARHAAASASVPALPSSSLLFLPHVKSGSSENQCCAWSPWYNFRTVTIISQ